jgi:HD-GYP domain-containing protein (c-di-GMP phosphodiesterase class II)
MSANPGLQPLAEVRDLIVLGEPLPFRVLDGLGRLLLGSGIRLVGERQLEALFERGAWVERDAAAAARQARPGATGSADPRLMSTAHRSTMLSDRWEQQLWALDALLRQVHKQAATAEQLTALVNDVAGLVDRDPDVALFHVIRHEERRFALYALSHALHSAVVLRLLGRTLGWDEARLRSGMGAALTMNLAIVELQASMAEQKDPPTRRQLDDIRAHPERGAQRLAACGVVDAEWLAAVREHHEQTDGKGYPQGLATPCETAQLLRVVDVYTAKISPRAFRAALTPQMAARQLVQSHPGSPLTAALIKTLGVYPPGELVQLKSGEIGVVTRRAAAGHGLMVAALTDRQGKPAVSTHHRDTADPALGIAAAVPRETIARVLPERVYGVIAG